MTKKDAQQILRNFLLQELGGGGVLPIVNKVVTSQWEGRVLTEYNFKDLLCIAYDLQEKPKEEEPNDISPNQTDLFQ